MAAEALARWRHPTLGPIGPDVIIPIAESSGCIHKLGMNVMRRVCADLAAMRAEALPIQRVAVKVAGRFLPVRLIHTPMNSRLRTSLFSAGTMPSTLPSRTALRPTMYICSALRMISALLTSSSAAAAVISLLRTSGTSML
ncbi:EAL domain-containing protein [Roseateles chitinivorans]|uniref:EAL domain-containing protein n=1 Tax=Roseateles chitinivorans TaxID=2917965 RepID=UPI003D66D64D